MTADNDARDAQLTQWESTFDANPQMYGTDPSESGSYAIDLFRQHGLSHVMELGAGQGRDATAFLRAGFRVTAMDYSATALAELEEAASRAGQGAQLTTVTHDVRRALPLPDASVEAVYSHMLFNMALTTSEIEHLAAEVARVLRPGGFHVYTVRHVGDAHFGAGTSHGDGMYENGGFIVHFFDRALVERLTTGCTLRDVSEFEEGTLPRRLWRVTLRRNDQTSHRHMGMPVANRALDTP